MTATQMLRSALAARLLCASACGGLDPFEPSEDPAMTRDSLTFAVSIEDSEGRTRGGELALAIPGCAQRCVPTEQARVALPVACARIGASFELHDDGGRCRSPVGSCRVEDEGGGVPSVRCVVAPASVEFVVELR